MNDKTTYCFLDFETTGLDYRKDQIIEVGIIKTNSKFEEIDRVNFFVQLEDGRFLPSPIIELTGITKRDLDSGIPLRIAKEAIARFIGNSVVVCHHAAFNLGFIHGVIKPDFYCTRTIHCIYHPNESHTLINISKKLGFPNKIQHRALTDAENTKKLFKYFVQNIGEDGIKVFKNKLIYMPDRPYRYLPDNAVLMT